jgi:hypothetical protein
VKHWVDHRFVRQREEAVMEAAGVSTKVSSELDYMNAVRSKFGAPDAIGFQLLTSNARPRRRCESRTRLVGNLLKPGT